MTNNVVGLILQRCLVLITGGVIVGTGGAVAAAHLLRGLLYGISPFDPLTLIVVVLLLTSVALLASYLPARHAASTDPNVTLKYE